MTREDPQLKLRLSPDLKLRLSEHAESNGRSMNAEIVHRLEESFAPPPNPTTIVLEALPPGTRSVTMTPQELGEILANMFIKGRSDRG